MTYNKTQPRISGWTQRHRNLAAIMVGVVAVGFALALILL